MIGLDTNVIIRYLVQDDLAQAASANHLMEGLDSAHRGFVSLVTLVEVSWVLSRAYRLDRATVADILAGLLASVDLVVEHIELAEQALRAVRSGADFADAVIGQAGLAAGCHVTVTFDRRAAQLPGMQLLS